GRRIQRGGGGGAALRGAPVRRGSEYVKKVHGGYFKVFVSLLGEEGETWHVFHASRGELPPAEDVDAYDGFVISGSCSDAHGDDQWIATSSPCSRRWSPRRSSSWASVSVTRF
ncbi:unnamed protein product, partial [Musa textilis]